MDSLNCFKTDEHDVLTECTGNISHLLIADGITAIGDRVFQDGNLLTEVIFPSTVTAIGNGSFAGCKWLKRVRQAFRVTSIGDRAFSGCGTLEEIQLSKNLSHIGAKAFETCTSLKEILLPEYFNLTDSQAMDVMNHAFRLGCNLYDTAIVPEYGDAEIKLEKFAASVGRNRIIISDKARFFDGNEMYSAVLESCENLETWPDIYFVHQADFKGILVNKVYAAGILPGFFSVETLIQAVLSYPISSALIGIGSAEQADAAMGWDTRKPEPPVPDFQQVLSVLEKDFSPIPCSRCQRCYCPYGTEIHTVFRQYNYYFLGKNHWALGKLNLGIEESARMCRKCTDMPCLSMCPANIRIPDEIWKVRELVRAHLSLRTFAPNSHCPLPPERVPPPEAYQTPPCIRPP